MTCSVSDKKSVAKAGIEPGLMSPALLVEDLGCFPHTQTAFCSSGFHLVKTFIQCKIPQLAEVVSCHAFGGVHSN